MTEEENKEGKKEKKKRRKKEILKRLGVIAVFLAGAVTGILCLGTGDILLQVIGIALFMTELIVIYAIVMKQKLKQRAKAKRKKIEAEKREIKEEERVKVEVPGLERRFFVTEEEEAEETKEETEEDKEVRKVIEDIKAKAEERKRWVPIAAAIPLILSFTAVIIVGLLSLVIAITTEKWTRPAIVLMVILLVIVIIGLIYLKKSWIKVPSAEVWMVEVFDGFYEELKEGAYFIPYWLKKIPENKKISKKELRIPLFTKGEKIELPEVKGFIEMTAKATVIAVEPMRIAYAVAGGSIEIRDNLVPAKLQDAIQTHMNPFNVDEAIVLKGKDISDDIWKLIKRDFTRWGLKLVTLLLEDFDISEKLQEHRTKVYEAEMGIEVAKKAIERKRLEGEAEAEKLNIAARGIAKDLAGIRKKDEDLTEGDFQEIAKHLAEAWDRLQTEHDLQTRREMEKTLILSARDVTSQPISQSFIRETLGRELTGESSKEGRKKESEETEEK